MIYKSKVQGLLESLEAKLRLIENISTGAMKMDAVQVNQTIQQAKAITEHIIELVNIER
jgi:hypothetical protein